MSSFGRSTSTDAGSGVSSAAVGTSTCTASGTGCSTNNNTNGRFETFTEAVPLSLSSMAHANIPLDEGVVDGVRQILSHTMSSCVHYARIMYPVPPGGQEWSYRDLVTSPYSWTAYAGDEKPIDVPFALEKLNFKHQYCRSAFIYLKHPTIRRTVVVNEDNVTAASTYDNNNNIDDSNSGNKTQKPPTPDIQPKTTVVSEPATFERELEVLRGGATNTISSIPTPSTAVSNWQHTQLGILGRITLQYISTEELTPGEMDGTDINEDDDDDNDMPPCLLYKVLVEYRSIPASGKEVPILAEELSMLSFGGSIDDDVKYGALASLYDSVAKYVLEIYSVRGKKYKFDLMDSTLSDGTVPRLPSSMEGHPFAKCLCVTVTNHTPTTVTMPTVIPPTTTTTIGKATPVVASCCGRAVTSVEDKDKNKRDGNNDDTMSGESASKKVKTSHGTTTSSTTSGTAATNMYAITRIHLTLEGKPRIFAGGTATSSGSTSSSGTQHLSRSNSGSAAAAVSSSFGAIPAFDAMSSCISSSFISLNPNPPLHVSASTSGHRLLLDPSYAGHIYINGRYITTWNEDVRIGSNGVALYGMDLQNIVPIWQGRITDYEVFRDAYAQLWHELLVDSKVAPYHLSRSLLYRLMKGKEPKDEQQRQQRQSIMLQRKRQQQNPTNMAVTDTPVALKKAGADVNDDDFDDDDDDINQYYDDDDDDDEYNDTNGAANHDNGEKANSSTNSPDTAGINVNVDCLETQVLGTSTQYDRVGIAAKALATRFALEFGNDAYPCLSHETTWVRRVLPNRQPIVVPERLINILRRGGYFNIQQTCSLWFEQTRALKGPSTVNSEKDTCNEIEIVTVAIQMLEKVGCTIADLTNITVVTTPVQSNVVTIDDVCRYDENTEQFYVHEKFFQISVSDLLKATSTESTTDVPDDNNNDLSQLDPIRVKGYLLGMYIAKAHPYGKYLAKYVLWNRP